MPNLRKKALAAYEEKALSTLTPEEKAEAELRSLLTLPPEDFRQAEDCDTEWRAECDGISFRVTKWAGEEYNCFFLTIFDAWHGFKSLHELGRLLSVGSVRIKGVTAKIIERDEMTE